MIEVNKAIEQLSEIHRHLSKTEIFRGLSALPIAIMGLIAILGGYFQPYFINHESINFIYYWFAIAVINIIFSGCVIAYNYLYKESQFDQKRTLRTIGQVIPAIVSGLVVTGYFIMDLNLMLYVQILPPVWNILFSLGIFSAKPYLPRWIIIPALYFLVCGFLLMFLWNETGLSAHWKMPISFGIGFFLSAGVFYWENER